MPDLYRKQSIMKIVTEIPKNLNDLDTLELYKNDELGWLSRCGRYSEKYFTTRITSIAEITRCLGSAVSNHYDEYGEQNIWKKITGLSKKLNPEFPESIKSHPEFENSKYPYSTMHAWQCQNPKKVKLIDGPGSIFELPLHLPEYLINAVFFGATSIFECRSDDYDYTPVDLFVPADE
jgi:hypothetical protein